MNSKTKYWKIECTKQLSTIFQTKVDTRHLTEKKLKEFIIVLISKYALSDDEILEQHLRVPFKKIKDYIQIQSENRKINNSLIINFSAQVADISVVVSLTE